VYNSKSTLRYALLTNAGFSGICGLVLVAFAEGVGRYLGPDLPWLYRAIGAGLLVFSADLVHQATSPRMGTWRALYSSLADSGWVLASLLLLLLAASRFTDVGMALIAGTAAVVLGLGLWQLWAVGTAHRVSRGDRKGWFRHCVAVDTSVKPDVMWDIIADLGGIRRYMPSLRESRLDGNQEPGVGAVRTCEQHSGKRWSEECIEFNPGTSFSLRFLAEAPDFPYPAREMVGSWEVSPSGSGSQVTVWWELIPKPSFLASIILPLLAWQVDRTFPRVIQRMAQESQQFIDTEAGELPSRTRGPSVRLLQRVC
jgi:hypothetical protein